jgi:hypothetical protein
MDEILISSTFQIMLIFTHFKVPVPEKYVRLKEGRMEGNNTRFLKDCKTDPSVQGSLVGGPTKALRGPSLIPTPPVIIQDSSNIPKQSQQLGPGDHQPHVTILCPHHQHPEARVINPP